MSYTHRKGAKVLFVIFFLPHLITIICVFFALLTIYFLLFCAARHAMKRLALSLYLPLSFSFGLYMFDDLFPGGTNKWRKMTINFSLLFFAYPPYEWASRVSEWERERLTMEEEECWFLFFFKMLLPSYALCGFVSS
jgi:hypothetical protein